MEIMNAPIINTSNQNENLILRSEENGQLNTNVNQYFVEKKDQSSMENETFNIRFFYCNLMVGSLSFFFLIISIFPLYVIPNLDYYLRIAFASSF